MLGSRSPLFFVYVANCAFCKYDACGSLNEAQSEVKTFKSMNTMLN